MCEASQHTPAPPGYTSIICKVALFSSREAPSVPIALSSGPSRCTGRRPHHNYCIDPCSPRRLAKDEATKHAHTLGEAHKRPSQSWPPSTPMPPPCGRGGESKLQCPSTKKCGSLDYRRTQLSHTAHTDTMATTPLVVRLMPAHPCRCQGKARQRPVRSGWQVK